jgi:4-amino-4-deoxy-L-arabinose transferase-like glycosyltransferase
MLLLLLYINQKQIKQRVKIFVFSLSRQIIKNRISDKDFTYPKRYNSKIYLILFLVLFGSLIASLIVKISTEEIDQISTERIRALVSLEMKYSNNYITPTINGEYYYNKPPLFNIMLLPFVDSEHNPEFKLRMVTVISFILLSILVFWGAKSLMSVNFALLASLLFAISAFSCSDHLSLDPVFSFFVVLGFLINYILAKKEKYWLMFILSYLATAIAFLIKGVPALWFQMVSLISIAVVFKTYRTLFSIKHLTGIAVLISIVGTFFFIYSKHNSVIPYLDQLFIGESSVQLNEQSGNKLFHLLSFVGKSILSYVPVMLMFPILLLKRNRYHLLKDPFNFYVIIVTLLSSVVFVFGVFHNHYLLPIIPLLTILVVRFLPTLHSIQIRQKIFLFLFVFIAIIPEVLIELFYPGTGFYSTPYLLYFILGILSITLIICISSKHYFNTLMLVFASIISITFIVQVIQRNKDNSFRVKKDAARIISTINQSKLYIYPSEVEINHASIYYLSYYYKDIIRRSDSIISPNYYLTTKEYVPTNVTVIDSISQKQQYRYSEDRKSFATNNKLYLFAKIDYN